MWRHQRSCLEESISLGFFLIGGGIWLARQANGAGLMKAPLILMFSIIASLAASDGGLAQTNLNPAVREESDNLSSDLQSVLSTITSGRSVFR